MILNENFIEIRTLESGTIYKRADGILILRQVEGRNSVKLQELKNQLEAFLDIQKGELSPLIVVVSRLEKLENEEKMFLMSTITKFANKVCIVTNSPIPTFIFNIIFFLFRPTIPSRIFKTEKEAFEWSEKA